MKGDYIPYEDVEHNGIKVGTIENNVYVTTRKPNHFMRKYAGFGISEHILSILKNKGIEAIRIKYYGKTVIEIFETKVSDFIKSPMVWEYSGRFGNNDRQKFVPIHFMDKVKSERIGN